MPETMLFTKQTLQNILYDEQETPLYKIVLNKITDKGRWTIHRHLIFKRLEDNTFWSVPYSEGATEYQEEGPWEHEGEYISCTRVVPVEYTAIKYEPVPDNKIPTNTL